MGKTKASAVEKPEKPNLQKVQKTQRREVDAAMVIETFKSLKEEETNLEKDRGFALVTIRNHIQKTFGLRMGKARQVKVKEVMKQEYDDGRIIMTNSDGKLNFTKRFDVIDDDEEEED